MVKSYNDPVKQKSREKLRDFIAKNLLTFKKPRDIKVVCFPGAEVEGEEGLEVKEVYDKLDIPRENIVGLEYNLENAEKLKKASLGIKVVNSLDLDFFKNSDRVFDIISLDYTGYRDESKWLTLHQIAGRQRLYSNGILATNYSINREQKDNQAQMVLLQADKIIHDTGYDTTKIIKGNNDLVELIKKFQEDRLSINLDDLRDSLSYRILTIMRLGTSVIFPMEILKAHPNHDYALNFLRDIDNKDENLNNFFTKDSTDTTMIIRKASDPLSYGYRYLQKSFLSDHIEEQIGHLKPIAKYIVDYLTSIEAKAYFPREIERYSYISNKKTTMHLDLFAFSSAWQIYKRFIKKISYNKDNFKIKIDKINKTDIQDTFQKICSALRDTPERIYLGSSWVPPKRKEKISKEDAIYLLKEGCSPAEISECYRGFTTKQLGAFKAHYITMGKNLVN